VLQWGWGGHKPFRGKKGDKIKRETMKEKGGKTTDKGEVEVKKVK
jgi:hypothetical protein